MPELIEFRDLPQPMDDFRKPFVHPDNIAAINRRKSIFEPLSTRRRWRIRRYLKKLQKSLNAAGYNPLCERRYALWQQYEQARRDYFELKASRDEAKGDERKQLSDELHKLKQHVRSIVKQGKQVSQQLDKLADQAETFRVLIDHLEYDQRNHRELVRLNQQNKRLLKEMRQENRIFESLLLDCFAGMTDCHYVNRRDRIVTPRFRRRCYTVDSHFYLLETSRKNIFGRMVRDLPYRIRVDSLIKQDVVNQMSFMTGKQVEVIRGGPSGSDLWYRVNRLEAPGGLPTDIRFSEVLAEYPAHRHRYLPFPVGVTVGRMVKWHTFADFPNLLIGGSAGSGKSNELNCIIATAIMMNTPDELRLVLVDMKGGLELRHFEGIPHQLWNTITNPEVMLDALHGVLGIIKARTTIMGRANAKIITDYNERVPEDRRLPRVVVVIDELATILGLGKLTAEIHTLLTKILNTGRALGVHVILCTQIPKKEVVPTMLKGNLNGRMAGQVVDDVASTIILDTTDASNLSRIPGRMFGVFGTERFEFQTAYISDEEVARSVARAKEYPAPRALLGLPAVLTPKSDDETEEVTTVEAAPETVTVEQEYMRRSLDHLNGNLSAARMHEWMQNHSKYSLGEWEYKKVVERIKAMSPLVLDGVEYRIKKRGKSQFLEAIGVIGAMAESVESPVSGEETPIEPPIEASEDENLLHDDEETEESEEIYA